MLVCARNQFLQRGSPQPWKEDLNDDEIENFLYRLQDANANCSQQNEELLEDNLFIDVTGQLVKTNDQVLMVNFKSKSKHHLNFKVGTVYYREPYGRPSDVRVYVPSANGGPDSTTRKISIHNLIKILPSGTNHSLLPPKSPTLIVDWSKMPSDCKKQPEAAADKKVGLSDLSPDVKQHIASYLPLFEVEFNLRRACRDTFWNFKKPPPDNLEYDFVYFLVSNTKCRGDETQGVAHTTNDVLVAIRKHDWMGGDISVTLKFVKFDRKHDIVPLMKFVGFDKRGNHERARLDPLGCHYCGVQQASHVELDRKTVFLDGRDDPDQTAEKEHCAVFRHCRDWTPREPRIPLRLIGPRKNACRQCGHSKIRSCTCETRVYEYRIYYSPQWFKDKRSSSGRDKSLNVFSE